jgi:hypothetical protein
LLVRLAFEGAGVSRETRGEEGGWGTYR